MRFSSLALRAAGREPRAFVVLVAIVVLVRAFVELAPLVFLSFARQVAGFKKTMAFQPRVIKPVSYTHLRAHET